MDLKNKIINNSIVNAVFSVCISLINFFLLPFMLAKLGAEQFGLIGICSIFSLSGYLQLLDLGFQTSIVKYVAEFHSQNNQKKLCQLINATLFVFLGLSLIVTVVGFLFLDLIGSKFLSVPIQYVHSVKLALSLIFISYLFEFPNVIFAGVIEGLQRYDVLKGVHFFYSVIYTLLVVMLLSLGYGFMAVILVMVFSSFLRFLIYVLSCFKILPFLKIHPRFFSRDVLREIRAMTKYVFIGKLGGFIHTQSDRILIGIFLGPVFMTSYEILGRLTHFLKTLMGFGYAAIMPAASVMQAVDEKARLDRLYLKGWRMNLYIYAPIVTAAIVLSQDFLEVWVGREFSYLTLMHQLFVSQHLILLTVAFGSALLMGMNARIKQLSQITLFGTAIKIILLVLLVHRYQLWGVTISLVVSMILPLPFNVMIILKEFHLGLKTYLKEIFIVLSMMIAPGFIFYLLNLTIHHENLFILIGKGMIWCVSYWLCLYLFAMDVDSKKLIHELLAKVLPKRKLVNET